MRPRNDLALNAWALVASARREWRVARRYPDVLISAVVWPAVNPIVFVYQAHAFTGDGTASGAGGLLPSTTAQLAVFLYLGWLVAAWFGLLLTESSASLAGQRVQGSLETTLLAPATRLTLLFGTAPVLIATGVLSYLAVMLSLVLGFGAHIPLSSVLAGGAVLVLAGPALAAIAAVTGTTTLFMRRSGGLVDIARAVSVAFCGFTAPMAILPDWAERIGRVLPPTWTVDALRDAVFGTPSQPDWPRLALLLSGTFLGLVLLARAAFAVGEHRGRRAGTLGGM
ncbi:ABC transporter permease [Streptomyces sp. NPDC001508]|uniref:ABC transporter permease n=1 Tax=Streptomyces sp. NPDC001508 TaxID=3154656 RepID=UPI00331DBC48